MQEKAKFNIFHTPLLSFFSQEFYRDVIFNWKGYGIAYLCLLTLIFIIPEAVKLQTSINQFLNEAAPKVISQFPVLTLKDGTLSMDTPSPHGVYYDNESKPIIIIDTTKAYKGPKQANVFVYLTDRQIFFKKTEEEYSIIELSRFDDLSITHDTLYRWVEFFKQTFIFIFAPLLYLLSLVYFSLQVLICTSIGVIIAKKVYPEITYMQLMRLSAVAFTPPVMLQVIHTLLDIEFAYSGPISFLFALCYLYFGLKSGTDKKTSSHH